MLLESSQQEGPVTEKLMKMALDDEREFMTAENRPAFSLGLPLSPCNLYQRA
jgi:hypothetical protein